MVVWWLPLKKMVVWWLPLKNKQTNKQTKQRWYGGCPWKTAIQPAMHWIRFGLYALVWNPMGCIIISNNPE